MGGFNGYVYAPNPIGWVDPYGLNNNPLVGIDLSNKSRSEIENILSNSSEVSYKGGSPDKKFMQWKWNDNGQTAVRLDPPDKVTLYDHAHLYDKNGNPLDKDGNIVPRESPYAHIPIGDCK